jgi:tetratricopeptide (TPR) repeat protein
MEKPKPNNTNNDRGKTAKPSPPAAKTSAPAPAPAPPPPVHVPPLFRKIDWLAFAITTVAVFIGYYLTLAPDVTLEDSGELATASFYAGVPHPPGYPVWTMFTYLFTLIPHGSVAWRVALASAVAGALACGLLAFLISRGSSMMMEGIAGLKTIDRRWENAICVISGFAAGCLQGYSGFMWSQADIVEVYCLGVLSLMSVLLCLLRWIYAPHQRRYLYAAFFLFGICLCNHQTLVVAAMGIEVAILAVDRKVGRNLFIGNGLFYLIGLAAKLKGVMTTFDGNAPLFVVYNLIGIGSLYIALWYSLKGKISTRWFLLLGHFLINVLVFAVWVHGNDNPDPRIVSQNSQTFTWFMVWINPIGITTIYLFCLLTGTAESVAPFNWKALEQTGASRQTSLWQVINQFLNWKVLRQEWSPPWVGLFWYLFGAAFYLIEPIASMANPPMNWGYPRTDEGFWHAFTRGQYERTNPTDILHHPLQFLAQIQVMLENSITEYNWVYILIALVPFFFYRRMQKRERAWLTGITAIYLCLSVLLLLLLNPSPDRASQDINRVLFASANVLISMGVGYGLTLIAAFMAAQYQSFRRISLWGGLAALDFAVFTLIISSQDLLSNALDTHAISLNGFGKIFCWLVIGLCLVFARQERFQHDRPMFWGIAGFFGLCDVALTVITLFHNTLSLTGLHDFVDGLVASFSPNQYALPVFAGLLLLALVLIYLAAVFLWRNRAPLVLTLGLFAVMPVYSVMTHWFNNEQRGHWFGYWFGHDMFSPPFGIYPPMARNAILFGGTDPGRFVPTYMIFCESFVPPPCKPMDPNFDRRDVYIITQNALADGTYLDYIRAQYFRSAQQDPPFFKQFLTHVLGMALGTNNALVRGVSDLAYHVLDVPLTKWGARVEARRRAEGVYPPKEIYTPSAEDSAECFREYMTDAQRRAQLGELRPGEDVTPVTNANGQVSVQVSGTVAVMMINGLLCKVIFDHNPTNEFYVEESFPLDWMYPHETPFGIIMKINRKPLTELPADVFKKDHEFWSKFSARLIGNWINDKTTVQQIAAFAHKVYLQNNFTGFTGSRKFIRDDDAQKSFSKLRDSQAGVYAWRLGAMPGEPTPPEYQPHTAAEREELIKAADFAFKQSFAFCPYSPETVFRYVNFLLHFNRLDDALVVAKTCLELDPYNSQVAGLVDNLEHFKKQAPERGELESHLQQMQAEVQKNPNDFTNVIALASLYLQTGQSNQVAALFDQELANPAISANEVSTIAQYYAQTHNFAKLEEALEKLVKVEPGEPESWYDLAALKAVLGKNDEALQDLKQAVDLSNQRLKTDPKARNLLSDARTDARFNALRKLPEFQKIVPPS